MIKQTTNKFSPEVRSRAVRLVQEHRGEYASEWATIGSIAAKIDCTAETLRSWVRQAERDQGLLAGPTTDERERMKALERENRELRQATRSCARRLILPRRSSTAGSSHDRVHRRLPRHLRGRADLQSLADRPFDISRLCCPARRSRQAYLGSSQGAPALPDPCGKRRFLSQPLSLLQHIMWVVASRAAVLSVITGGGKWVEITTHADPLYQHLIVTAERKFWRCVESGDSERVNP